ncbi:unnamed protein product [Phytomonas sp. EM1]|nr:unnamed protein product [Phytomonas sp. EM1]|eukprot:CCW64681.1 unnamed protein product [Phytomonas sp. isolate EM1]
MALSRQKTAFITGITGQDGSYLTELLIDKGYVVHGMIRRSSSVNTARINHLCKHSQLHLHYGDITDSTALHALIARLRPDEVYNLAAQSHVKVSFEIPEYTGQVCAIGTLRLLDAIVASDLVGHCRFYQASSSELYGRAQETPQSERTPFYPCSPYAVAKLYAHWITVNYREAHGIFACNGILFNHESPRRGDMFVTKKVARAAARIRHNKDEVLRLGNLDALRDWGHTEDFVRGMWQILQHPTPQDWVLATGEQHSVRELCNLAFSCVGYDLIWEGEGVHEFAYDKKESARVKSPRKLIVVDEAYFRPIDVDFLVGDSRKARYELGWKPTRTFEQLVSEMVQSELRAVESGLSSWV